LSTRGSIATGARTTSQMSRGVAHSMLAPAFAYTTPHLAAISAIGAGLPTPRETRRAAAMSDRMSDEAESWSRYEQLTERIIVPTEFDKWRDQKIIEIADEVAEIREKSMELTRLRAVNAELLSCLKAIV